MANWCKYCMQAYQQSPIGKATQARGGKKYRQTIKGCLRSIFHDADRRCNDYKHISYKYYGAKGIRCLFKSFDKFFIHVTIDLGFDTYEKIRGLEIHRTKKHYKKDDIEFLTDVEHRLRHKKKKESQK